MNTITKSIALPLLASLALSAGGAYAANSTTNSTANTPPPPNAAVGEMRGQHDMHHHGRHMPSLFMASLHQLNLTDAQHKSVESLLDGFKQQREANKSAERSNLAALGNPGDKNYAAAVQAAKTQAAADIQQRSDLETQIYNLLTAEQKAKLPQVLANMKAKHDERREQWQEHHHDEKNAS